jgi:hypothetical protein
MQIQEGREPWGNLILGIINQNAPFPSIYANQCDPTKKKQEMDSDTATEKGRSGAKGREARVTWGRGDEAEAAERNDVVTCCSSQARGLLAEKIDWNQGCVSLEFVISRDSGDGD